MGARAAPFWREEIRLLREKISVQTEKDKIQTENAKLQEECVRLLEEKNEKLKEEIKKLKGYLGEVGSLLDRNIVDDVVEERRTTTIFADDFDKLTNNEFV